MTAQQVGQSSGDATDVVELVEDDGHLRLSVRGELDLVTRSAFDDAVDQALQRHVPLVIDLRPTTFLGSSGIAAIVRAHRRAGSGQRPIRVIVSRDIHGRALEITGVDQLVALEVQPQAE